MVQDDTDGSGPEIIELQKTNVAATYAVAAHYWSSHDYGPSTPTLQLFINDELVHEQTGPALIDHDLWEIGTISGETGEFTPIDTVTPDFFPDFM